jgi:putative CocE/NonD family hydrolase
MEKRISAWAPLLIAAVTGVLLGEGCTQARADSQQKLSVNKGVKIPMRDGINLAATIYRPQSMPKPLPVIFCFTPYGADNESGRARWYARRGYVVATVDVRGCSHSEGEFKPFENEGRDGHDVVEWLARQPWSNGKVAMYGGSYLGWSQWSTIKEFPPHLETISPSASTYPGTEGIPKNRNIFLPYVMSWLNQINKASGRPSLDGSVFEKKKYELYKKHLPFNTFDKIHGNTSAAFQTWIRHPGVDAYWDAMNPSAEDYARIDKPILTVTGHFDADQTGAMTHYRRHVQHASPEARKKHYLIIGPWDHGGSQHTRRENAGLTFDRASLIDFKGLHRQWYDWTLKGGRKPAFLKKNVAYYVMGAEEWKYADSLEAIPTKPVRLYLSSPTKSERPGKLSEERPGPSSKGTYTYDPLDIRPGKFEIEQGGERNSYNIMKTNAGSERYAMAVKRFGNGLIYDGAPFPENTELTGYVKLVCWISMNVPDTDFMVTLHEITPDGKSIQLTDDALRARYRESPRKEKPVTPGEVTRYEFRQFWFFSRELARGSRLRLVFWSPNSIHLQKNYNSGGVVAEESKKDARTAHVVLHHGARHTSYLEIPVAILSEQEKTARAAARRRRLATEEAERRRVKEIEAATIDRVIPNTKLEDAHNQQGKKSKSGAGSKGGWRDASGGGWFSYDMKVLPGQPVSLMVTYWGGDEGRSFDILVNDRRIATQRLNASKPVQFIDVTYEIPARLTRDKQKVTVKFQAHPSSVAGGVFGCRTMRARK